MRLRALFVGITTASVTLADIALAQAVSGLVVGGSGTISGTFINPAPACIPSSAIESNVYVPVCDIVNGNSSVSWGNATGANQVQSRLQFTPTPFLNVVVGQVFTLGTLTYYNGSTFSGTSIGAINLSITTTSTTSAMNGQSMLLPFTIIPTINGVSPDADADFVYFSNATNFGSFRVREAEFATVELLGRFGSLHNEGFGLLVDGTTSQSGFVTSSIQQSLVPEPSTFALAAGGLALLFLERRRRVRKSSCPPQP